MAPTNNKPINQYKLNTPPVPTIVNTNKVNNIQNHNNNNNKLLKQDILIKKKIIYSQNK